MGLKPQGIDLNPRKCHNIESMFQSLMHQIIRAMFNLLIKKKLGPCEVCGWWRVTRAEIFNLLKIFVLCVRSKN